MNGEHERILTSLRTERTVDILTTGRRSGETRTTEIWTTCLDHGVYICGTPNAGRSDTDHSPRDWMANLLAEPRFTLRLKRGVDTPVDLEARAEPVTDPERRRWILTRPETDYYRDAIGLEPAVAHSPIVKVVFEGDAAWLDDAVTSTPGDPA